MQAFYLEKTDVITYCCYRCAKNQNKLCDSLGARVQVTMGNNHKQVRYFLIESSMGRLETINNKKSNNKQCHNKAKKQ